MTKDEAKRIIRNAISACNQDIATDYAREISEYFEGQRTEFSDVAPLLAGIAGTEFQKRVWAALCDIPYGQTRSYSDIAAAIGSPKAARAVGSACHANPLPVLIPCHRVVPSRSAADRSRPLSPCSDYPTPHALPPFCASLGLVPSRSAADRSRPLSSKSSLGGYAFGTDLKQFLLQLETLA